MIDLHTHTTASDGSVSPPELIRLALQNGLEALAITDHDTLEGCDEAAPVAAELGLEMIAGIELSTRLEPVLVDLIRPWLGSRRLPSIHLLGYFLAADPPASFRSWILGHQESRHKRNLELVEKLRGFGFDITLPEVSRLGGKLTGRPHFAELLLRKGYVKNRQEAFDLYLADTAQAAVEREEPGLMEGIGMLRRSSRISGFGPSGAAAARRRAGRTCGPCSKPCATPAFRAWRSGTANTPRRSKRYTETWRDRLAWKRRAEPIFTVRTSLPSHWGLELTAISTFQKPGWMRCALWPLRQ